MIEITLLLEEEFEIELEDSEMKELKTVQDVIDLVETKCNE